MNQRKLIMIEFNELTPSLMERFIDEGELPNFKRLREQSHVYMTDASEEVGELNPWVQWVTVHAGVPAAVHGVQHLSEGCKLKTLALWDILSSAGLRVWVCGSMNARFDAPLDGYLLPDPWSCGLPPYPPGEFDHYYNFVRLAVQEHTNKENHSPKKAAAQFVAFMARHGLTLDTAISIVRQLIGEFRGKISWRRAALLDQLQWNLFRHYFRVHKPHFSTFFVNSTAHFQHKYWRHMEPAAFEIQPDPAERKIFSEAISYGYRRMDGLIGEFLKLADRDTTIVFCTALSQQPHLNHEAVGGKRHYRPRNAAVFRELFEISGSYRYEPVMAEQAFLRFDSEQSAFAAAEALGTYTLGNEKIFNAKLSACDVLVTCRYRRPVAEDAVICSSDGRQPVRFYDAFYDMEGLKSGRHHPDGMLWIRRPEKEHCEHRTKVSLCAIAPFVLRHFGIETPDFMKCQTELGARVA